MSSENQRELKDDGALLRVKNLKTYFFTTFGVVRAVDGVSFDVPQQSIVGIVGESGCGKSVAARSILGIVPPPGKVVEGSILYYGQDDGSPLDLARLNPKSEQFRALRGKEIAMIFQEPMSALSPVHTVGNQIIEAIRLYEPGISREAARARCLELLGEVGIPSADKLIDAYIFELSGGMRQRVLVAMALSGQPKLLMADEPTTAIDVTIQAKVLDLLRDLHTRNRMSIIFITHNMGVIAELAQEVIVMYLGSVAEKGRVLDIFDNPRHPYTLGLLASIPRLDLGRKKQLTPIEGLPPDLIDPAPGCPFAPRCSFQIDRCLKENPTLETVGRGHMAACWVDVKA